MTGDATIVFTPSGRRGRVPVGTSVLDAARGLGVDVDSICGGRGICGRCQVEPAAGAFAGLTVDPSHLAEPDATEQAYAARKGLAPGRRLSCAARVLGDVAIEVPPTSRLHRQVVRKRAEVRDLVVDPVVRLHYIEVDHPSMARPSGDLERLRWALAEQWQLEGLAVDPTVLARLQPALREGDWAVTVAVHDGGQITAVWPGFHDAMYGVAYDVGSTTVAGHLADLATGEVLASAGTMNPQIRFGEDLMSRVSYVMLNEGGAAELTAAVREALDALLGELAAAAGVSRTDVLEVALVGNPIMHHLVLGIDPTPLGTAPFALATDVAVRLPAAALGLAAHPGARVYVLPCIAGHVGADAAACILSEGPHRGDQVQLLVDVGTNAEIVLGSRSRLLAASSPTGPAFEGAQISAGQRAAPGAIERVRIDPETLEPRFRVIGDDRWSDEPGFDAAVTGICGSGIIEAIAELYLAGVVTADGVVDPAAADRSPRVLAEGRTCSYLVADGEPRVAVTQNDVRAIQLAKAALHAGARLLMDHLGVDEVDQVRLAGAFGSHIDPKHAMILGLIPDCELSAVSAAGNAAGTGALMALLSAADRAEIEEVARTVEKIETAVEPRFQEHFVAAMAIPHGSAPYERLRRQVDLPYGAPTPRSGRRRRARAGSGE